MSAPDDFFSLYFKYVADTEPPIIFHRWSVIPAIGALLGRQFWLPFGDGRLFPNHYTMLIGDPGTRKSTAIKRAKKILRLSGYDKFSAETTTKEKLMLDLAGMDDDKDSRGRGKEAAINVLANLNLGGGSGEAGEPAEVFIAADEFNNFMGSGNLDFQSLLGEWWDWDEPETPYKRRLKNSSSIAIWQPTVNILGGNTPSQFAECFPLASIGQGFMSRLILIHADPSGRKITFPQKPSDEILGKLIEFLQSVKAVCHGPMQMDSEAENALDTIYKGWLEMEDARFRHYCSRRFTHLLKLCLIIAASRLSTRLSIRDVIYANTLLSFAETTMPKAIGELGKSRNSEAANKIMQVLYTTRQPLDVKSLWRVVDKDLEKTADLASLLMNLQIAEKIQVVSLPGGGHAYLAKIKPMSRTTPFTNMDLLKGKEIPE